VHVAGPLAVGVAALFAAAWGLVAWGRAHRVERAFDVIIVPGARVYADGRPSPALLRRIEGARALWERSRGARVVGTGHRGEAACIARELIALGIPEDRLIHEPEARNTAENAARSAKLLARERVVVVTDDFHVLRCKRLFREHFPEVEVHSVSGSRFPWRNAMRELASISTAWTRR